MTVSVFIQARMSSSRLPGKVLAEICGKPMFLHVVERALRARLVDTVHVLTSLDPSDEPLVEALEAFEVPYLRGSLDDVLDRFEQAARRIEPEYIVRLTADCPLIDPAVIDQTIEACIFDPGVIYAASRRPTGRTYPVGIDVEVCSREALGRAHSAAQKTYQREHVTPWFYDGSQGEPTAYVEAEVDASQERWTVDTAEDLAMVRRVFELLPAEDHRWQTVLQITERLPQLRTMNAHVVQKNFRDTGPSVEGCEIGHNGRTD